MSFTVGAMQISFRLKVRVFALAMAVAGCSLTPPSTSPAETRQQQKARMQQTEVASAKQQLEQDRAIAAAELSLMQTELMTLDVTHEQALRQVHEQQRAYARHWEKIDEAMAFAATCAEQPDALTAAEAGANLAHALAEFVSEPRRDQALEALERCRIVLAKASRKQVKEGVKALQREFAIEIEDAFDENNPHSRGGLTATVKGSTLGVRMRGNFEGRARHSQDQVDSWCAGGAGLFTKISLENAHGTFTCGPDTRPKDLIDSILEDANIDSSWKVSGAQPTPTMPSEPPPPPPETQQRRAEIVAEIERLAATLAGFDSRVDGMVEQERDARQITEQMDRKQRIATETWGQRKITRAANTQVAGAAFTALGGALLIGTVGATQAGLQGARGFLPIAIGVSGPVVISGVLLLVGGGVRKQRVRAVLGCTSVGTMPAYCKASR
jgi:hypothetical protein